MKRNVRQCGYYPECPHDHPALTLEDAQGIAARIYCLPQHGKKVLDPQFVADIANAILHGDSVTPLHVEPINLLNRTKP